MGHIVGMPGSRVVVGGVPDSGPELISDLQLWCNANSISGLSNDAEISTQLEDDSGNARHPTGVAGNVWKPKYRSTDGPNSKPAIRMATASPEEGGYFTLPNFLTGYTSGHVFAVVKLDNDPPASIQKGGPPTQFGSGNSQADLYPYFVDSEIYDTFGSTARKTTNLNPATSLATWHVYEARSASGAWSVRINGGGAGDIFSTATNTVGFTASPRIGSHSLGVDSRLCGLIAEVIFYSRVLNGTEITDIYNYLEAKYLITLP